MCRRFHIIGSGARVRGGAPALVRHRFRPAPSASYPAAHCLTRHPRWRWGRCEGHASGAHAHRGLGLARSRRAARGGRRTPPSLPRWPRCLHNRGDRGRPRGRLRGQSSPGRSPPGAPNVGCAAHTTMAPFGRPPCGPLPGRARGRARRCRGTWLPPAAERARRLALLHETAPVWSGVILGTRSDIVPNVGNDTRSRARQGAVLRWVIA